MICSFLQDGNVFNSTIFVIWAGGLIVRENEIFWLMMQVRCYMCDNSLFASETTSVLSVM